MCEYPLTSKKHRGAEPRHFNMDIIATTLENIKHFTEKKKRENKRKERSTKYYTEFY